MQYKMKFKTPIYLMCKANTEGPLTTFILLQVQCRYVAVYSSCREGVGTPLRSRKCEIIYHRSKQGTSSQDNRGIKVR